MRFSHGIAVAMLALLPPAAAAQQAADPADANAPVPATAYVSVFRNFHAATEPQATPDTVWRAANQEVAGRGMEQGRAGMPESAGASAAAKDDPHAGRRGHHH